jgi:ribokinase
MTTTLTVIGSVNLDIVARAARLPLPGETVTGGRLARYPGGKGANQALAAQRLGARVRLIAAVGSDDMAEEALVLLRAGGVDLSGVATLNGETTGVALINVAASGENQIMVCPGANDRLQADDACAAPLHHIIGVLEVPVPTLLAAAEMATGFVGLNFAPALPVPEALIGRADLIVVNQGEAAVYGARLNACPGLVAISLGADGAALYKAGTEIARARPPEVTVVDTVGAGDTFTAALTVALIEGQSPAAALTFAVTAAALACTKAGAQPSLPMRAGVAAALSN